MLTTSRQHPTTRLVGRWAIGIVPEQIAEARRRGTYIGMGVVAVDAPRLQRTFHDEVVPGAAHVVHDFFAAAFLDSFADAGAERF